MRVFLLYGCRIKWVKQNISISKHRHIGIFLFTDMQWYVERFRNVGGVIFGVDANIQPNITKTLRNPLYIQCFVFLLLCFFFCFIWKPSFVFVFCRPIYLFLF
jgi:hypothetical protein